MSYHLFLFLLFSSKLFLQLEIVKKNVSTQHDNIYISESSNARSVDTKYIWSYSVFNSNSERWRFFAALCFFAPLPTLHRTLFRRCTMLRAREKLRCQ